MSHGGQIHPEQKKTAAKRSTGAYYPDEKFSLQLIAALDQDYDEKELFIPFEGDKCVSLLNKPKIFFIQVINSVDLYYGSAAKNIFLPDLPPEKNDLPLLLISN